MTCSGGHVTSAKKGYAEETSLLRHTATKALSAMAALLLFCVPKEDG